MRFAVAFFATSFFASAIAQERLILPREVEDLAKAHHCEPVSHDLESDDPTQLTPFDISNVPPKIMIAAWCTKGSAKPASAQTYTLLIWVQAPDNPLRTCPDEIQNVPRIGSPRLYAGPMVPHDFTFMDTGLRLTVRDSRIMFGVRNLVPGRQEFYACIVGRWAHYAPERK